MTATVTSPTSTAPGHSTAPSRADRLRAWGRALVLGRPGALVWERPALLGLLGLTAVMYIWNLGASGWANSFYSAAVQAGSVDWTAFFYGSSDAANSITVDKPPASLWLMALSVRIFGLSSWSILVPEALMGVATVAILYATVRRRFGAGTALLAGGILSITPVAALMFRFNNPDALLVLLLTLAAYFTVRGLENGRMRWVIAAGAMIGLGFLTKQLQAFLLLPALAGAYLVAAPRPLKVRIGHSFAALGAVIVAAGWWVAIVELVPESWRPYIGGSQTNSFLELTFGYNGLGRLTGNEVGSVTGGGGGNATGGMWGSTGITRLLDGDIGGQIAWLLPAALVLTVVGFLVLRHAPRTSVRRGILIVFAGWMIVTALAFSFMAGIFHAYYTVALAPAIAAVVAIGASWLWQRRADVRFRIVSAALVLGSGIWAWILLDRATDWQPWIKFVVVALSAIGAAGLLVPPTARGRIGVAAAVLSVGGLLLGPAAYTLETVTTAQSGSIVTAGPSVSGSGGFGGGGMGGGMGGGGQGGPGGGGTGGPQGGVGQAPGGTTGGPTGGFGGGATGGGGAGGLLGASTLSDELAAALSADSASYTWVAAAIGSNSASGYQLATELPVMPIGGFNGSDPSPTLAEFQELVSNGEIHFFIGGSIGGANGGSSASSEIASWVEANFTSTEIDGVTLYDLTT